MHFQTNVMYSTIPATLWIALANEAVKRLLIVPENANPYIWQFANESDIQKAMSMIRCGFELETQAVNDMRYNRFCDCNLNDIHWDRRLLTYESDGTVEGPEIQTTGAMTSTQFAQAAMTIFKNNVEVDTRCSFHIHVSLPEINHSYGRHIQAWIYEYLISHLDEVPECVLTRWRNKNWMNRFFGMTLSTDKYSFVAYRGDHKTWEFRCFGNVSSAIDAMTCLQLATKAMQYAYLCKYKVLKSEYKKTGDVRGMSISLQNKFFAALAHKFGEKYEEITEDEDDYDNNDDDCDDDDYYEECDEDDNCDEEEVEEASAEEEAADRATTTREE
jgi:hypothetical protein